MLEKNLAITCMVNATVGREAEWSSNPSPSEEKAGRHRRRARRAGSRGDRRRARAPRDPAREGARRRAARCSGSGTCRSGATSSAHRAAALALRARSRVEMRFGVEATCVARESDASPIAVMLATGSLPQRYAPRWAVPRSPSRRRSPQPRSSAAASPSTTSPASGPRSGRSSSFADARPVGHGVHARWRASPGAPRSTAASPTRKRLREHARCASRTLRAVKGFTGGELAVEDASTGELERLPASTAWWSRNTTRPTTACSGRCAPRAWTVKAVGDCLAPRTALEAVYEGHAAAQGALVRILVTGASGFVGVNLVEALRARRHEVVEFSLEKGGDVTDTKLLEKLMREQRIEARLARRGDHRRRGAREARGRPNTRGEHARDRARAGSRGAGRRAALRLSELVRGLRRDGFRGRGARARGRAAAPAQPLRHQQGGGRERGAAPGARARRGGVRRGASTRCSARGSATPGCATR